MTESAGSSSANAPVALVTGGARRVGRTIVTALAARGYRLAIHAHQSIDEAQRLAEELSVGGTEAAAFAADLRDAAATAAMIGRVADHFGRLDALVNSAAVWHEKRLEEVTPADLREHWEANTLSTFVCCQQAGLRMVAQSSGGAIVNIGDWAIERPYVDYAAYFPSKGAIPALTRSFAVELASRNPKVRVNAILPGPVLLAPDMPPAERQAVIAATLLKRLGTPEDVAQAVIFLLESPFITGVSLPVDGGRTIFGGQFGHV